jgi:hypothetical protein
MILSVATAIPPVHAPLRDCSCRPSGGGSTCLMLERCQLSTSRLHGWLVYTTMQYAHMMQGLRGSASYAHSFDLTIAILVLALQLTLPPGQRQPWRQWRWHELVRRFSQEDAISEYHRGERYFHDSVTVLPVLPCMFNNGNGVCCLFWSTIFSVDRNYSLRLELTGTLLN